MIVEMEAAGPPDISPAPVPEVRHVTEAVAGA
jgi:hypothetical protein